MAEFRRSTTRKTRKIISIRQVQTFVSELMFDEERSTLDTESSRATGETLQKVSGRQGGNTSAGFNQSNWTVHTVNNINGSSQEPTSAEKEEVPQGGNKPTNGQHSSTLRKLERRTIGAEIAKKAAANPERFQGVLLYVFQVETALGLTDEELVRLHQIVREW